VGAHCKQGSEAGLPLSPSAQLAMNRLLADKDFLRFWRETWHPLTVEGMMEDFFNAVIVVSAFAWIISDFSQIALAITSIGVLTRLLVWVMLKPFDR